MFLVFMGISEGVILFVLESFIIVILLYMVGAIVGLIVVVWLGVV